MLPNLPIYGATSTFNFDQAVDFPINLAPTMQNGVCSGLSLHWIKKHKLGQMATFVATIRAPSSIRDVENFQSNIGNAAQTAYDRTIAVTGLSQGVQKDFTTGITANRIAQALALTATGYELISFVNTGGQHTVALARSGNTIDFFDANYGCGNFPSRTAFQHWFNFEYWNLAAGPGNPAPCTRFMILSFV